MLNSARRLVIAAGLAITAIASPVAAEETLEARVKAAFIYNFAKFVEWPAGASNQTHFEICVAGQSPLGKLIDTTLTGKSIRDQAIRIRHIGWNPEALPGCRMLYLSNEDNSGYSRLLNAAREKPVLTISEDSQVSTHQSIIQFMLVDGKVRFAINQNSAREAQLKISAKLLEVAIRIPDQRSLLMPRRWAHGHGYAQLS